MGRGGTSRTKKTKSFSNSVFGGGSHYETKTRDGDGRTSWGASNTSREAEKNAKKRRGR